MASVCSPRRQLVPTVGPAAALAGVHIRAGLLTIAGERVVTALIDRRHTVEFGSFRICYGTVPERQCLSPVLVAPDPPRSALPSGRAAGSVKVLVVGAGDAGKGAAAEGAGQTKSTRTAKPPTERDQLVVGASAVPPETPLQAAMSVLVTPIAHNIDPATAQAELEVQRQKLLSKGEDIIRAQRKLNLTLHYAGREESGKKFRAARAAYVEEEMPPPRHRQARAAIRERYEEADSGTERIAAYRNTLGDRLGERCLPDRDAGHKLDRMYLSEMVEAEGPPGPKCFGPRIMREEPPVRNFTLPQDTKTYDGTTKPEDWLADYVTAVYVAGGGGTVTGGGNRRWAVRIVPSFLVGQARIWLNKLLAGSINGWLDFEEAFVCNFSSTYRRPNRPPQLTLCVQRSNETDRDYLTRWNSTRNCCEGIATLWEIQCNRQYKLSRNRQTSLSSAKNSTGITGRTNEGKSFRIEGMVRSK
ncbi:hypothetical protein QYE76_048440 [Lolium multiflorum]|uniref:Retrotransposon gag domain-containing protein n=1 Tax=Lolium multiflorum TaxID=4521 RepID=A0AAD8WFW3_LOLMU|nr:hypothetical protein QYE76_048440 [Lolium multiflorum]